MKKTQIFTLLTVPVWLGLFYFLQKGIFDKINTDESIKVSEAAVIDKLKFIREAETKYVERYGRYTANWDSLEAFLTSGKMYLTEKKEIITRRPANLSYLGDSVRIQIDTIGTESVRDVYFPAAKYSDEMIAEIRYIPGLDNKIFTIFAGEVEKNKVMVDVIEVIDGYPVDKTRSESNSNRRMQFLRFGSMTEITTSGNWE